MLVNTPVPKLFQVVLVPLLVVLLAVVGFWTVPYATPLAVSGADIGTDVTFPPVMAAVDVMPVADVVVNVADPFTQRTERPLVRVVAPELTIP